MSAARSVTATRETLLRVLAPAVQDVGLDLEDVTVQVAGKRRLVRIVVDADGGVSLDGVAAASQAVSQVLDDDAEADAALGGAPYVLEVTSPGVDRPLTETLHWRRAVGRLVAITLVGGAALTGRLRSADDDTLLLEVDGAERTLARAEVLRARVEVEFSRPDAPQGADGDLPEDADEDLPDGSDDDDSSDDDLTDGGDGGSADRDASAGGAAGDPAASKTAEV